MIIASDIAVDHAVIIACSFGISPIIIGMTLIALGTDLPEIVNSILSSAIGHANISIGDSIGSVLAQLTLVLGLLPFIVRPFKVIKKEILIMGGCLILALVIVLSTVEKGFFTWINGLIIVGTWPIYLLLTEVVIDKDKLADACLHPLRFNKFIHLGITILGFVGVAIGVTLIINGVLELSSIFNVPDFIISFFMVSIGTSLPELVVDIGALRKGETEIAVGDLVGSCIIDASIAVGIGQVFFPQAVSTEFAVPSILYIIIAAIGVIFLLSCRQKVDKKTGIILITIYLLSYLLLIFLRTRPATDIVSLITRIEEIFI